MGVYSRRGQGSALPVHGEAIIGVGQLMRFIAAAVLASLGLVVFMTAENQAGDKAKHTIADVMKVAMKGGLCKKVASGKGSDDEKKQLVELFESLGKNTPPKGDAKAWKEKTDALLDAAKKGDGKALGKAANCKACHDAHKG